MENYIDAIVTMKIYIGIIHFAFTFFSSSFFTYLKDEGKEHG